MDKLDLDIHRGSEFKNWKSQWEAFVRLSKLDQADPQMQVDILTLACSTSTWKNMGLTSAQMKSVPDILKAVDKYAQGLEMKLWTVEIVTYEFKNSGSHFMTF